MRLVFGIFGALALSGCVATTTPTSAARPEPTAATTVAMPAATAARTFVQVVDTVEPVAEKVCRSKLPLANCDFQIVVDDRPNQPPNAFQTVDKSGRPIIAFTIPLIAEARNADELAFVMGHEAAHHISEHIPRQQENAMRGAVIFGAVPALIGGDNAAVKAAQNIGADVGARSYSKDFELEADALGTVITKRAGYDPIRGAEFFTRIPDPGNRFLGTHPPNAARIETVRRVANSL